MRFLRKCWPWLGYSSISITAFFFKESNISIKLFNFFRTAVGFDWICAFWGSAGLPEKEPWIKRHLLQRPGYQTTNKSDVTAADEICLANCRWNELLVFKICELKEKKETNKQTKNIKNLIMIYHCEAYRLSRIIHNVISLNNYAWEVRTYSYHLVEGLSYRDPIHFQHYHLLFFFFKVTFGRLPYPRLKLFSFPLILFSVVYFRLHFKDDWNKTFQVSSV